MGSQVADDPTKGPAGTGPFFFLRAPGGGVQWVAEVPAVRPTSRWRPRR